MPRTFFHTAFIFLMNNAIFVIHSIIHSIVQQNYSFKEFIHSKKHANYSFKDFIHSKKIQNNSFKKFIHSRKSKIIHSKKIFIQVKNGLSPMAKFNWPQCYPQFMLLTFWKFCRSNSDEEVATCRNTQVHHQAKGNVM